VKFDFTNPSLLVILALIFMLLKLWGVIAWSWFWVLSPLFIPILTFIGIIVLYDILTIIYRIGYKLVTFIKKKFKKK
jgi:hypothetical protein